jgi:hypothetical protein
MKTSNIKIVLVLLISTLIFYGLGAFLYDYYYHLQINIISYVSDNEIHLFGKLPFWFFGDPYFRLITAIIPLSTFVCVIITKNNRIVYYLLYFGIILSTLFVCSFIFGHIDYSRILINDDLNIIDNKKMVHLRQIRIIEPYLTGILFGFLISGVTAYLIRKKTIKPAANNVYKVYPNEK